MKPIKPHEPDHIWASAQIQPCMDIGCQATKGGGFYLTPSQLRRLRVMGSRITNEQLRADLRWLARLLDGRKP